MDHHFLAELKEGSIHLHDDLQFELKLEFKYNPNISKPIFTQEFYLFVPEPLLINSTTYLKSDFYLDQTNFIRYKTPDFTFEEILNPQFTRSPLNKLPLMRLDENNNEQLEKIINEIKLFGNIFRSTLRDNTLWLINKIEKIKSNEEIEIINDLITIFCENVNKTQTRFLNISDQLKTKYKNSLLNENIGFVDEFITNVIEYYLIGFLEELRAAEHLNLAPSDQHICDILISENKHRKEILPQTPHPNSQETYEMIAYRQGLLQKFMIEALQLKSNRIAVSEQHGPLLGSIAAGIAMLIYMLLFLFTWKSPTFVINSIPFVLSVVIFYILKDRIKEGVKSYYKQKAGNWFPDFKTKIYTLDDFPIGELTENFSFIAKSQVPKDILKARNEGFHTHLENLHRHENIIYYKREVKLFNTKKKLESLKELNMIFRYNIHRYLQKASDPIQYQTTLEEENYGLAIQKLPKVYHINIVMKESHPINGSEESIIKKYRVILNKRGIRQVENL
jgi:hypothetical protein